MKIELTNKQLGILKKHLRGEYSPFGASLEDQETMNQVIIKADTLMRDLNAYDELDGDLMQWFWNKYKAQK